ncbi:MAG: hypothetical protein SCH98_05470 [Deferrisomatales bacterium]|nr:hypothetical protein [Deferrisomatales bacterium]
MRVRWVFGAALALGLLGGSYGAHGTPRSGPLTGLDTRPAALTAAGELDRATADLYRLYALMAADRLPRELRAESPEGTAAKIGLPLASGPAGHRCGTPILRAVRARLDELPAELRAEAEELLAPPRPAAARSAGQVGGKDFSPVLLNWVVTENFSIQWGPDLTNEDGSLPVRDLDANGIPDVVERWAELFEASYRTVAEVLKPGVPDTVPEGTALASHRVPVYIANSSPDQLFENIDPTSGIYAFTVSSPIPYIVVNNDLRFVPPNDEGPTAEDRIRGAMKITAAHEFFHVIHFLYEPSVWNVIEDDWWLETSATWMEDEVFGGVNDYHQYYPGWTFFVEAGLPVPFGDDHYVTRAYGGAIFAKYLSEHVAGRRMMGELWDLIRPAPAPGRRILQALDVWAASRGFSDLEEMFLGFTAANAVMDYEEGGAYGAVPIRKDSLTADSTTDLLPPVFPPQPQRIPAPSYLGATYLLETGGGGPGVQVALSGAPAERWGLSLVLAHPEGYSLALGASAPDGETSIAVTSLVDFDRVYAIPSYLTPPVDPAASVSYATTATAVAAGDPVPPGGVGALSLTPAVGGFDASWSPPGDPDAAGHVVRWKLENEGTFLGSRTFVAPVTAAEVRGLDVGTYDVDVFAYDRTGNRGPSPAVLPQVVVSEAGREAAIPPADEIILGAGQTVPTSGGGGGGGGCFLTSLGP